MKIKILLYTRDAFRVNGEGQRRFSCHTNESQFGAIDKLLEQ